MYIYIASHSSVSDVHCHMITHSYFIVLIDGRYSNGSVSVLNACRLKAPDGKLNTIKGYAYRPNEDEQGKLKVVFGGSGSGGDCKYI